MSATRDYGMYVKRTRKPNGRTYLYFRGPGAPFRLNDDATIARRQAIAFVELQARPEPGDNHVSNAIERRIAGRLISNALTRSKRRGDQCDLTAAAIIQMLRAQRYRCAVSGLPFDLTWREGKTAFRNPFAPSIDRQNSSVGYLASNCRIVLSAVNYGINEWGEEIYTRIAVAVAALSKKKVKGAA